MVTHQMPLKISVQKIILEMNCYNRILIEHFFPPRILTGSLWTYLCFYFQPIFEILHTLKLYIKVNTCIVSTITFSKSSYKIHYVFGKETHKILLQDANSCYRYYKIYKCKQLLSQKDVIKISIHTILHRNLENVCLPYRYWNLHFK